MRTTGALIAAVALLAAGQVAAAQADTLVTNDATGSYSRYDGAVDATMASCSTGRRSQNEPSVAVDPANPQIMVAGSNDYCAEIQNGSGNLWTGYYRSTDGGASWSNSLVPGYPADDSPAGTASPAHGSCAAAGDPTQSFDGAGRLYYGFICFNRVKPTNGSIYLARYDNHGASYVRTVRVERGTPSVWGLFQDKINVAVDQSLGTETAGNVYVAWARYPGQAANNVVFFTRSSDGGRTFSKPQRLTEGRAEEQFADIAVGPQGNVYVTYREIAHQGPTQNRIRIVRSTDGGQSFTRPVTVASIDPFDSTDFGPDTCGDGPFACCERANVRALLEPLCGGRRRRWRARGLERPRRGRPGEDLRAQLGRRPLVERSGGPGRLGAGRTPDLPGYRLRWRSPVVGLSGLARRPGLLPRPPAGRQRLGRQLR